MNGKKTDLIDEALKLVYLANADSLSDEDVDKELFRINTQAEKITLSPQKETLLLSMLAEVMNTESLGKAISRQLTAMKITAEELAKNMHLPLEVVQALIHDEIYTNNIPIQIFKRMLEQLKLNASAVEHSIRKTLQLLSEKTRAKDLSLQPAFRKGFYHSRGTSAQTHKRTDGKELFENSESMEKYINRLKELMQ